MMLDRLNLIPSQVMKTMSQRQQNNVKSLHKLKRLVAITSGAVKPTAVEDKFSTFVKDVLTKHLETEYRRG